VDGPFILV